MDELRTVAGLVNLFLLIATALVLVWFVWRVFLRKLWRVRRIENARLKRILEGEPNTRRLKLPNRRALKSLSYLPRIGQNMAAMAILKSILAGFLALLATAVAFLVVGISLVGSKIKAPPGTTVGWDPLSIVGGLPPACAMGVAVFCAGFYWEYRRIKARTRKVA